MTLAQALDQAQTTTVLVGKNPQGEEVRICRLEDGTPNTVTVYTESEFFFWLDHRLVSEVKAAWNVAA